MPDALHWSLRSWSVEPETWAIPSAAPDWAGSWAESWEVHGVFADGPRGRNRGTLDIQCLRGSDGVLLDVVEQHPISGFFGHDTEGVVECRDDDLLSPVAWSLESVMVSGQYRRPIELSRSLLEGTVSDGTLALDAIGSSRVALPRDVGVTCLWSLLGAMPGLFNRDTRRLGLTLLEDLQLPRTEQRLEAMGGRPVTVSNGTIELFGYRLHGRGVTPTVFWLAPDGSPVYVRGISHALLSRRWAPSA